MTLRPVLLFFALLSFLGAVFLWFRTPPAEDSVFGPGATIKELTGTATTFRPPKGSEDSVRLLTANGAELYTDCLAIPVVCSGPRNTTYMLSVVAHFLTPSVFWPISVSQLDKPIVTRTSSVEAYRLYVEKEGTLYRLPLALAAFFVIGAVWLGNRPAFD